MVLSLPAAACSDAGDSGDATVETSVVAFLSRPEGETIATGRASNAVELRWRGRRWGRGTPIGTASG